MSTGSNGLDLNKLSARAAAELRRLLDGVRIAAEFQVDASSQFCSVLELLIPELLRRAYPIWASESIDGFVGLVGRRTAKDSAQLFGLCILITDQTLAPFLVDLTLGDDDNQISRYRICVGEAGGGVLGISGPRVNSRGANALQRRWAAGAREIVWVFDHAGSLNTKC